MYLDPIGAPISFLELPEMAPVSVCRTENIRRDDGLLFGAAPLLYSIL